MIRNYFAAAFLTAALMTPICAVAQDDHRDANQRHHRYYDREHKDYHQWNDNEDRAYRQYLTGRHEEHRDFSRLSRRRQRDYWTWRHNHQDTDQGDHR